MAATPHATLIDVVVLVFARSELKNLVGTDALRTVLSGSQRALFPEPNTMSLQPIWELIESQPGFDPDKAVPPMCRLKTWEGQLKVKVEMPTALADLDLAERDRQAMSCNVGDDDLNKVLKSNTPAPAKKEETTRAIESSSGDAPKRRSGTNLSTKVAIVFAVLGLAAAGVSIYFTLGRRGGDAIRLSANDINSDIPMTDVRRKDTMIVATLSDLKWLDKPELIRRAQLEAAAPRIRAQQATRLLLLDSKGALIATVRPDGKPPVTFARR